MAKKLFIRSYGCQMNVYDSARMADVLAPLGYVETEDPAEADLIILNTCHIREKAAEKVYSEIGRLRAGARGHGTGPMLAVAGCVAQAEGTEIFARAPEVDLVVGPQSYHRLPELVARAARRAAPHSGRGGGVHDTDFPAEPKFDHLPPPAPRGAPSAFLTVQEGCDKFCAFCVVPYTRGAEYSRPAADVLAEARALVAGGAREIMLLGQNVNAYHGATATGRGEWGLARLIRALAEIDGLQRLRYTTSHPRDMDDDLIAAHGEVPALMPYLHLPVQSGSDDVLARMNRRHRVSDYLRVIDRLRAARPDIALASDFIVGHPGETDADFAATLDLVERVGYAQAYSFKYSRRPGTPAAAFDDQVPEAAKIERLAALQDLLNRQQRAFNAATTGRVLPVLIERPGKRPGQLAGRSPYMQAVHFDSHDGNEAVAKIGRMADVRILAAHPNSLAGAVVSGRPAPAGARAATA